MGNDEYDGGDTATFEGLEKADQIIAASRQFSRLPISVILITDGKSQEPKRMDPFIENIIKQNADIIAVGVGSDIDEDELKEISRNNKPIMVENYAAVQNFKNELIEKACEARKNTAALIMSMYEQEIFRNIRF